MGFSPFPQRGQAIHGGIPKGGLAAGGVTCGSRRRVLFRWALLVMPGQTSALAENTPSKDALSCIVCSLNPIFLSLSSLTFSPILGFIEIQLTHSIFLLKAVPLGDVVHLR